jgi:hypothetical protein
MEVTTDIMALYFMPIKHFLLSAICNNKMAAVAT